MEMSEEDQLSVIKDYPEPKDDAQIKDGVITGSTPQVKVSGGDAVIESDQRSGECVCTQNV